MKFRKVLCGVTAALTVLSSTAVVAQAEEAAELKLITAPFSAANNAHSLWGYGGGYFAPGTEEDDNSKFFHIGEKELAEWRETGKFTFTNVESDLDTNGMDWYWGDFDGGYIQFVRPDANGSAAERYVVYLDKANNKITTAYKLDRSWHGTSSDGYSLSFSVSGKEMAINVYDPSGKKTTTTLTSKVEDFWWAANVASAGDNLGYIAMVTDVKPGTGDFPFDSMTIELYAIKRNGKLETVYKNEETYNFAFGRVTDNSIMFADQPIAMAYQYKIYSVDNGKTYNVGDTLFYGEVGTPGYYMMIPDRMSGKLYGTKAVVGCEIGKDEVRYSLIELLENDTPKVLSKQYKSISTKDGKIYFVQTSDDKYGYIDGNGKELAMFDSAGDFDGDYAPVLKDGKAYLIDRNMNKVSEDVAAEYVSTLGDGLYNFTINGQGMLVTYANADKPSEPTTSEPTTSEPTTSEPTTSEPTTSEPTTSEPTTSEPTTSEPTISGPTSSDSSTAQSGGDTNPATGAAVAFIPIALVGGAAVAVTKKRNK